MNWKKRYRRLEDRVLLDAAGAVTVADAANTTESQEPTDAQVENRAEHLQEQEELTNLIAALGESQEQADQAAADEAGPEILFVDSQVDDFDQLLENLDDNVEVYFIGPDDDGVALIADVLENSDQTYSAIHIVSHGNAGELRLGTNTLTSESLVGDTLGHVEAWGNNLTETGDILIYGCSVAEGNEGTAFVQQLADITGADIAASIDDTGDSALGGDWDLEVSAGQVETELAIPESTQVSWNNLLVTVTDRGGLGGDVGDDTAANQALVDQLAPPGSGVDIGSVVFDNTVYDDRAIGTFTDLNDPSGNVLLERGVVIATGFVENLDDAPGGIMGDDLNSPGAAGEGDDDPDLNASWLADSGQELDQFDITVFEFTFTPNTDVNKVALNYVFATEEDQGFAFGNFPDLFGIYIRNDTAGGSFEEFVFSNLRELHTDPDGGGPQSAPLQSNASGDFESNFVTGVQNAVLDLGNPAPGTQFTIKFALADHSDTNYDSAAFFDWLGSALRLDIDADDSNASGIDYATQFDVSTGSTPAHIVDVGDVSLQNFDPTTTVQTATIRLTNAIGSDALAIDTSGLANIDSTNIDTSVAGEITLTIDFDDSATSTADVVAALEAITYANGDNLAIDQTDREVTIVLSDGETNSSLATTTIDVVGVMDAPTVVSQTATTLEPVITGTFDGSFSDTLVVVVDGQTFTGSSLRGSPSFTPGLSVSGNTWTLDLSSPSNPLPADGTYDVQVTTTNAAGNILDGTSGELFIDSTGPAVPVVNPLTTNSDLPTITGTYDNTDGTVTQVVVNGVTYAAAGPDLAVNLDGTWTLTIPVGNELPDGTFDVEVTAEDALGNPTTDTATNELVIDTTGPAAPVVDGLTTTSSTPTITGSFDETDGTVTQVEVNSIVYLASGPNLTVDGITGAWSLTIPGPDALPDGTYDVVVTAEDSLGNTSTDATSGELVIDNTPPGLPTVNPLATRSDLPTITGTYDNTDGAVTQVVVNGATYLATGPDLTVNAGGTWTLTIPAGNELPDGTYDVEVTAVDGAGNVSVDATSGELVVDNAGPAAPTVTALATSQSNPTISGTYDETDGTVTQVVVNGVTYLASGSDLTVNPNGTWSLTIPSGDDLAPGNYDVEVTAEDPLGNATVFSSVGAIEVLAPGSIAAAPDSNTVSEDGPILIVGADGVLENDLFVVPDPARPSVETDGASVSELYYNFDASQDTDADGDWDDQQINGVANLDRTWEWGTNLAPVGVSSNNAPSITHAFQFDGSVEADFSGSIDGSLSENSATFEFWLKLDEGLTTGTSYVILDMGDEDEGFTLAYRPTATGNGEFVVYYNDDDSTAAGATGTSVISLGTDSAFDPTADFMQVVLSFDEPSNSILWHINGQPAATAGLTVNSTVTDIDDWGRTGPARDGLGGIGPDNQAGGSQGTGATFANFEGQMAIMRLYGYESGNAERPEPLDDAQILSNYNAVAQSLVATVTEVDGVPANVGNPVTTAAGGIFTVNSDGSYSYDPNGAFENLAAGETATDSVTYTIENALGSSDTATLTITITGVNDAPVLAGDLTGNVDEGGSYVLTGTDLGYTDIDDDDSGIVFNVSNLVNGSVQVGGSQVTSFTAAQLNAGQVSFLHDDSQTLTASFDVNVEDGNEDGSTATDSTFTFTVNPINDPPVLFTNNGLNVVNAGSGTISVALLETTDVDDAPADITYTVTSIPGNGTLFINGVAAAINDTFTQAQVNAGQVTYTHDGTATVTDSFDFNVDDGDEDGSGPISASFAIAIVVDGTPPLAPTIDLLPGSDTGSSTTDNFTSDNTPTFRITFDQSGPVNQDVAAGDTVQLFIDGAPFGAPFSVSPADVAAGFIDITTAALPDGAANYSVTITDQVGNESAASTDLAVVIKTDGPAIPTVNSQATPITTPTITGSFDDANTVTLEVTFDGVTYTTSDPELSTSGGTWTLNVPSPLADGTYEVNVSTTDEFGITTTDTSSNELIINTSDSLVLSDDTLTVDEGSTGGGNLLANDIIGTADPTPPPGEETLDTTNLVANFDAVADTDGDTTWEDTGTAGLDLVLGTGVTRDTSPVTNLSSITAAYDFDGSANSTAVSTGFPAEVLTEEPTAFEFWLKVDPSVVAGEEYVIIESGDATSGFSLVYEAAADPAFGKFVVYFDDDDNGVVATAEIDLAGAIDPTAEFFQLVVRIVDDNAASFIDFFVNGGSGTGGIQASTSVNNLDDWGPETQSIAIGSLSGAQGGSSQSASTANNFIGQIASVRIYDEVTSGGGGETIPVSQIENNYLAAINADAYVSAVTGTTTETLADPDNGPATSVTVTGTGGGEFTVFTDGTYSYDPNGQFEALAAGDTATDTITYTVTAADGQTDTATLTVTVTGVNDPPALVTNDTLTLDEGATTTITSAFLSTTDIDDSSTGITYVVDSLPASGSLLINGVLATVGATFTQADIDSGLITYTHDDSETTSDSFNFSVDDGNEDGSAAISATFNFIVTPVNDEAPLLTLDNASVSLSEDASAGVIAGADADATDVDSASITFALTGPIPQDGSGNDLFSIDSTTGEISLTAAGAAFIDFESGTTSYTLDVQASDGTNLSNTETLTINVDDANEAPFDISLTGNTVTENDAGAIIGTLATSDQDAGDFHNYSVSDSRFEVNGLGELKLRDGQSLDFEAEPSVTLSITSTDSGGLSRTESFVITVIDVLDSDTTPPAQPTVNSQVTQDTTPVITGTSTLIAGEFLEVTVDGVTYTEASPELTLVGSDWTLNLTSPLADGTYDVVARATDASGNTITDNTTGELVIDTLAPDVPSVNSQLTNDPTPTITGSVNLAFGESLIVTVDGVTYTEGSGLLNVVGNQWTLNIPDGDSLSEGSYDVVARVVDLAGNQSSDPTTGELEVDLTPPPAPTVVSQVSNDDTPVITGSVDLATGDSLTVTVNGQTYVEGDGSLSVTGNTWSLVIPDSDTIPDGIYNVVASLSDAAGNVSIDPTSGELEVDTAQSEMPTVESQLTNSDRPTLRGTYDADRADGGLVVTVGGVDYELGVANELAVSGDTWTLNLSTTAGLDDGVYDVEVESTDRFGVTVTDNTLGELVIDTEAPGAPTVNQLLTSDTTPSVTGTATVGTGETLTVTIADRTYQEGDGFLNLVGDSWTLTVDGGLADGIYDVVATVADEAGNVAGDATVSELTVDATAPLISDLVTEYAERADEGVSLGQVAVSDNVRLAGVGFQWSDGSVRATTEDGFFTLDTAGNVSLTDSGADGAANDFENGANSYSYTVVASDTVGLESSAAVTLTVLNIDDAPPLPDPDGDQGDGTAGDDGSGDQTGENDDSGFSGPGPEEADRNTGSDRPDTDNDSGLDSTLDEITETADEIWNLVDDRVRLSIEPDDRPVTAEGTTTVTLPADTFTHDDPFAEIAVTAVLADGSLLPEYVSFDSATQTFTVDGEAAYADGVTEIDVKITGTDDAGQFADGNFTIEVVGESGGDEGPLFATGDEGSRNDSGGFPGIGSEERTELAQAPEAQPSAESTEPTVPGSIGDDQAVLLTVELTEQRVLSEGVSTIAFPFNTFEHTDPEEEVYVEATLEDGSPLPEYVSFDAATMSFEVDGEAAAAAGDMEIAVLLVGRDDAGHSASGTFMIYVEDLQEVTTKAESLQQVADSEEGPVEVDAAEELPVEEGVESAEEEPEQQAEGRENLDFQLEKASRYTFIEKLEELLDDIKNLFT